MEIATQTSSGNPWLCESLWEDSTEKTSNFLETDLENVSLPEKTPWRLELQKGFASVLKQRAIYLDSLESLEAGWISGMGEVPSKDVISSSKALLLFFENHVRKNVLSVIPRLVIGPSPRGGIGIEFHAEQDSAIFVTLSNDGSVEVDTKYHGYYSSYETSSEGIGTNVFAQYGAITE